MFQERSSIGESMEIAYICAWQSCAENKSFGWWENPIAGDTDTPESQLAGGYKHVDALCVVP
jgi:hypothetical protein